MAKYKVDITGVNTNDLVVLTTDEINEIQAKISSENVDVFNRWIKVESIWEDERWLLLRDLKDYLENEGYEIVVNKIN